MLQMLLEVYHNWNISYYFIAFDFVLSYYFIAFYFVLHADLT